jgi:hypothetical protein
MLKKIFLSAFILLLTSKIFAQQIPVGMCGIVYIYDANGARVKRTYFCNNGIDPYPTARTTELMLTDSTSNKNVEEKVTSSIFEKIDAIFPNPTTGKFSITFSSKLVNAKITIVDAQGKEVYQSFGNGNKLDFDLSLFASGIFYVSINENRRVVTQKIIKQ